MGTRNGDQFLNTRLTSEELAYQLKDANTRLLITEHPEHFSFENVTIISFPKKKGTNREN